MPDPEGAGAPLVIVGPTAAGKSSLALALAETLGKVQIISADAKAVYRGMDIGTAKPTADEQREVRHHLIDVVEPTEDFAMGEFRPLVAQALKEIEEAGDRAIIVGGTGLYVQAIVDGFNPPDRYPEVMAGLEENPDTEGLHSRLLALDPVAAARMEPSNRRRILRALEVTLGSGEPFSSFGPGMEAYPPTRFVMIGLEIERKLMDQRISDRYDAQMAAGFLDEVKGLPRPLSRTAAAALGYRELLAHLAGECTEAEALDRAKAQTRRFARRQQRWFRRDPRIYWLDTADGNPVSAAAAIAAA